MHLQPLRGQLPPTTIALVLWLSLTAGSWAEEPGDDPAEQKKPVVTADSVTVPQVRAAIDRSLALLETSTREYRKHRECFSCHHQALPMQPLVAAREYGFTIDEANLKAQVDWTLAHLKRGKKAYEEGRGQGGRADTAGHALWTLELGEHPPDETTANVAEFLLSWKEDSPSWRRSSNRPPSEASDFSTTYWALRALNVFGTQAQQQRIEKRRGKTQAWLESSEAKDTEDQVFRLRGLLYLDKNQEAIDKFSAELLDAQRTDGGWAQTPELASDAYATGSVLTTLLEAERITQQSPATRKAVAFLLQQQEADGSWHVVSRSKPFQKYFESGFPHGKDQFISMTASSWATAALLCSLPEPNSPVTKPAAKTP